MTNTCDFTNTIAQAMILRENGYDCQAGVLYYIQSRQRIELPITDVLVARTLEIAQELRDTVQAGVIPQPLQDSPKCPGCSLVGICLPDETLYTAEHHADSAEEDAIRRLYPARDDAMPLYVQEQGAYVSKSKDQIIIKKKGIEALGRPYEPCEHGAVVE